MWPCPLPLRTDSRKDTIHNHSDTSSVHGLFRESNAKSIINIHNHQWLNVTRQGPWAVPAGFVSFLVSFWDDSSGVLLWSRRLQVRQESMLASDLIKDFCLLVLWWRVSGVWNLLGGIAERGSLFRTAIRTSFKPRALIHEVTQLFTESHSERGMERAAGCQPTGIRNGAPELCQDAFQSGFLLQELIFVSLQVDGVGSGRSSWLLKRDWLVLRTIARCESPSIRCADQFGALVIMPGNEGL